MLGCVNATAFAAPGRRPDAAHDLGPDPALDSAVVTGAGSGIGAAVARALLDAGATVIAVDRRGLDELPRVPGLWPVAGDLRDPDVVTRVGAAAAALPRGLGLLAAVAGLYRASRLSGPPGTDRPDHVGTAATGDVVDELFAVNVEVPIRLLRATLPALERARGAVVTVSSTFGHRASRTGAGYGASKAAVEALTRCWAAELAPRGVRVNSVAPGPTDTPILAAAGLSASAIATQRAAERARIPLGRIGSADEVARWITELARPAALTGQVVSVDGGLSCE